MWLIPNHSPITAPPPSPTERGNNGRDGGEGEEGSDVALLAGCQLSVVFNMFAIYGCNAHADTGLQSYLFWLPSVPQMFVSLSENLCRHLGYHEQLNPPPHPPPPPQNCLLAQPRRYIIGEPQLSRLPAFEKERKRNPSANRSRTHTGVCWTNSVGVCSNPAGIPCSDPRSSASSPRLVI